MKTFKKAIALALCITMVMALPLLAQAKEKNDWIDGDTPSKITNRVTSSAGQVWAPSVRTNFHATSLGTLVITTPKPTVDMETKAAVSQYADAYSLVYAENNTEYGPLAKSALTNALTVAGAEGISTFTVNMMLYEGRCYKLVPSTVTDMEFMIDIPKKVYSAYKDYAVLRLNADGSVTYCTDMDTDPETLTFKTNYFAAYNVYLFASGPKGCFDAYKPVEAPIIPIVS